MIRSYILTCIEVPSSVISTKSICVYVFRSSAIQVTKVPKSTNISKSGADKKYQIYYLKNNYNVFLFFFLANCDVNKMTIYDIAEVDDIFLEFFHISDPLVAKKGVCTIIDIDNFSWRLLKWCAPQHSKVASKKMQALPFRDYRVHIVNESFVMQAAVKLVFPFLPEYIKKMVNIHVLQIIAFNGVTIYLL